MAEYRELNLPKGLLNADRTPAGLLVPAGSADPDEPAERSFAHTFVTWKALTGVDLSEAAIVERLSRMSAFDCLDVLGRLSCMLHSGPLADPGVQERIIDRLGWTPDAKSALRNELRGANGELHPIFFPQQAVHLARLAALHGDSRPPDNFAGGSLAGEFVECLLGIGDVFKEPGIDENDPNLPPPSASIPWILRQLAINERHDSELLWGRYFDILVRSWGRIATPEAFDAARKFESYTKISMADWLTTGFALFTRFGLYGSGSSDELAVDPERYFAASAIGSDVWRPFLTANIQTLAECRASLEDEEAAYGPTQYRAQAFEERPLLQLPDGRVFPLALDSLERRCTEGMFYELANGAEREGLSRSMFTGPFGAVFEDFVQRAWERMLPTLAVPRVHRQKKYMRGSKEVESTDAVLDGGSEGVVFCEIVSRRIRVATRTRGDWNAFREDLETGPIKKATQLDLNIKDYVAGALTYDGLRFQEGQAIWPMLVLTEGFPAMPPIPQYLAAEIQQRDLLQGLPPLAILGAEDLAHMEGLLNAGFGAVELLRLWKGNPDFANLPFPNFLSTLGDPRVGAAKQAPFYRTAWAELTKTVRERLFPEGD